jgi:hypothetical protein
MNLTKNANKVQNQLYRNIKFQSLITSQLNHLLYSKLQWKLVMMKINFLFLKICHVWKKSIIKNKMFLEIKIN